MIYIPKKNKKANGISLIFIAIGFVLVGISGRLPFSAFFSFFALACIVLGIQFAVRFVLPDYRYILDDRDNGTSDFMVCRRQGKSDVKLCHVSLTLAELVAPYEKGCKGDKIYNYCQNLGGEAYTLKYNDGEKSVSVIIECNAAFAREINARIGGVSEDSIGFSM